MNRVPQFFISSPDVDAGMLCGSIRFYLDSEDDSARDDDPRA